MNDHDRPVSHERLTPLDASFLHLEDSSSPMHVACVMVFDGAAPRYRDFLDHVESRLHLVPRYRQRLAPVPLGQGRPKWVDDERFDLRYHVRSTALPRPASDYELKVLAGRVFSQPLSRDRPLWELWLVEGLEDDRFAVLSKTHHAVVDGISGLDLLSVLFAEQRDDGRPARWTPRRAPTGMALLTEALLDRVLTPAELLRPARALLRRPRRALERVRDAAVGLGAFAFAGLDPAPPSPYNAKVGTERRFTWVRVPLDQVKYVKNALGGSVNDVVLTVVTGALRRHLRRGEVEINGLTLKAFVPVSIRSEDERDGQGNLVTGMIAPLPVGCPDPAACLREIRDSMATVKDSGQAIGAQALTELSGFAPPNLLNQGARLLARQRFINLVVTNVPGPQEPLYLAGRELQDIYPMVPLGKNLALGVAIVSYNGRMGFGLVGDFDAVPDLEELAEDVQAAIADLTKVAGEARRRQRAAAGPNGEPVTRSAARSRAPRAGGRRRPDRAGSAARPPLSARR